MSAVSPQIAYRETRVITLRPKQETIARKEIAQLSGLNKGTTDWTRNRKSASNYLSL
jgi:hypothetical protein